VAFSAPAGKSAPVHYLICGSCGRSFTGRTGTIFYDLRSNDEKVLQALAVLAKGMTLRGTINVVKKCSFNDSE